MLLFALIFHEMELKSIWKQFCFKVHFSFLIFAVLLPTNVKTVALRYFIG